MRNFVIDAAYIETGTIIEGDEHDAARWADSPVVVGKVTYDRDSRIDGGSTLIDVYSPNGTYLITYRPGTRVFVQG